MPTPEGHAMTSTEIWTMAEVADKLRVPRSTLRYWRNKGQGPRSFLFGHRIVFKADDVHAWIEEQYEAEQPAERPATWTTAQSRRDTACR